jgi:putative proteasome-type protease
MLCRSGAVFLSDSGTSAGMDETTMSTKMRIYEKPGDRVVCILSSGNLSLTQATIALIDEDLKAGKSDPAREQLTNRQSLYETVCYVGAKVREVEKRNRAALEAEGFDFDIHLIVGGQLAGSPPEVHLVYPQGNSIHATRECPFLQIGERKYAKPILDRGFSHETSLIDAVKVGLISIDATMKCNASVAPPIDVLCYEKDSLEAKLRSRLGKDDPYLLEIRQRWRAGLVKLVNDMPVLDFNKPGCSKPAVGFATAA